MHQSNRLRERVESWRGWERGDDGSFKEYLCWGSTYLYLCLHIGHLPKCPALLLNNIQVSPNCHLQFSGTSSSTTAPPSAALPQAFLPVFHSFWSPDIRQPGRTHSVQFPHHCSSGQGPTALTHQDQTQWNALSGSLLSQAGVSFPPNVKTRFQMIQNKQLAIIRYFPHTTEKIHTPYLYHQESRNISTQTALRSSERLFPLLPVTREFL